MIIRISWVILLFMALFVEIHAQSNIYLNISSDGTNQIVPAEVLVTKGDSTVYFAITNERVHSFKLPSRETYSLSVASEGYVPFATDFVCNSDSVIDVVLEKSAIDLEEFVVEGQMQSTKTAGGEVFRLSKRAKECGDPYQALSEIPVLDVNVANQSVSTLDGNNPLILIDGKLVNSGIAPIDPKFIEKVEVTEVVSAKYLQMGVDKVINIHLKRNVPMYVYLESRNRIDIPLCYGFNSLPFEVGTSKFAVSGLVSYTYRHKSKTETDSHEVFDNAIKFLSGENVASMRNWQANLTLKWQPDKSNYYAVTAVYRHIKNRMRSNSSGSFDAAEPVPSVSKGLDRSRSAALLLAGFYEHKFKDQSALTAYFRYNQAQDDSDNRYEEYTESDLTSLQLVSEKINGDHYTATIDYDTNEKPYGNFVVGNSLQLNKTKDRDMTSPERQAIGIRLLSDYTHVSYFNSWKNLHFMLSGGLQFLMVNTSEARNSFWRPRAAASLTYVMPGNQFMRLSYQLTNDLPQSWQLAAINTSTNPWLRVEGNPFLVPEIKHNTNLEYTKTVGLFRFNPYISFFSSDKIIEQYIRNEGDIAIQSFRNNGTYMQLQPGANIIFRNKSIYAWIGGFYQWDRFNGQSAKSSVRIKTHVSWQFNNFFLSADIAWRNRLYSAISETRYENPYEASVQFGWTPTKQITVYACLPYFWGVRKTKTYINQGGYSSVVTQRFKSESLRPWILISWTMRKNSESKIADKIPME